MSDESLIDPEKLAKDLDIPNWGKLEGDSIYDKVSNYQKQQSNLLGEINVYQAVHNITKINHKSLDKIHQAIKQERRTGRLIFDYFLGGISNITFEHTRRINTPDS